LLVTTGLPTLSRVDAQPNLADLSWILFIYGCALAANLIASNLDREPALRGPDARTKRASLALAQLRLARLLALAGCSLPLLAGAGAWPLAAVPAAELVALALFRPDERFVLIGVDGALLIGAAGSALALVLLE
jgi:hypothetical protein